MKYQWILFCFSLLMWKSYSRNSLHHHHKISTHKDVIHKLQSHGNHKVEPRNDTEFASGEILPSSTNSEAKREEESPSSKTKRDALFSSGLGSSRFDSRQIDVEAHNTRKTLFEKCPVSEANCDLSSRYRTFSGVCNNLNHPAMGSSLTEMERLMPAEYEDGVESPRQNSIFWGFPLPNPRKVSDVVHERLETFDSKHTLTIMQWGQFIDHDLALSPQYRGHNNSLLECGACDSALQHRGCYPILIPKQDKFFHQGGHRKKCMKFVRSLPGRPRLNTDRQQLNAITHFLDGSMVYGSDACQAAALREGSRLRVSRNPASHPGTPMKDLLPFTAHNAECRAPDKQCFEAGDERVNEQPGLTLLHTLLVREHNTIADTLAGLNPHWGADKVFQETRRIVVAMVQHITYNEFLPRILGPEVIRHHSLDLEQFGYYNDYNKRCSAVIFNEFATAAFRFGHSMIHANFSLMTEDDMETGAGLKLPLSKVFHDPSLIKSGRVLDSLVRGIVMSPMEQMDNKISEEVANHLFEIRGKKFTGLDLAALNIHRGRDHGLPSYNKYRQMCGLLRASDFSHLAEVPPELRAKLQQVYRNPNDIDLFTGLLVETRLPGSIVGPTLACLLGIQFNNLRQCDRFWYETGDPSLRFSLAQLREIRRVRLSALLCRNCDEPGQLPHHGFDKMDWASNPMTHCSHMNHLDLSHWRE